MTLHLVQFKLLLRLSLSIAAESRSIFNGVFDYLLKIIWNVQLDVKWVLFDRFISYFLMSDDLSKGLLTKKGSTFDKSSQDCLVRIQRIKQKNDVMQKQIGTDIEDSIRGEIHKQSQFIEKEINELKNLMNQMETKYRDPEAKNRLKQIKTDAQKQIERNKIILKDLINRSFRGSGADLDDESNGRFIDGGEVNFDHLNARNNPRQTEQKDSLLTDQQIEIDYDLQRKILKEKSEMINEVQQSTTRINEIMNDMGMMVGEQGENLQVISEQLMKTNRNVVATNANMDQAQEYQKKARKKYVFLVVLILLILLIAGGVLFFLLK